ncbi:MFS transporter [Helicobacter saguini]|nr:MFS transporter [Helicobacter saguini]
MIKKIFYLNLFTMIFIALNLRAPITSIAPIVENVRDFFSLSSAQVGFLTSLPLIAFGVFSFFVSKLHHIKAMIFGLLCIVLGEILRSFGGFFSRIFIGIFVDFKGQYAESIPQILSHTATFFLFFGTLIMGVGIAIANVLLPSFIKAKFPRQIPKIMSIYSLTLNTSAILGLLLSLVLMRTFGLLNGMAFWAIFGLLALIFYLPQAKNARFKRVKTTTNAPQISLFKSLKAWKIAIFMGLQSYMFYGIIVWLPKIIESKGYNIDFSTNITLLSQFIALFSSFLIPTMMAKMRNKYKAFSMFFACFMYCVGMVLLLLSHTSVWLCVSAAILGIPMGSVFTIALLFIAQKSSNVSVSIKLSALSQGSGYLIASISPFVVGRFYDIFGDFRAAICVFIGISLTLCLFGFLANKVDRI